MGEGKEGGDGGKGRGGRGGREGRERGRQAVSMHVNDRTAGDQVDGPLSHHQPHIMTGTTGRRLPRTTAHVPHLGWHLVVRQALTAPGHQLRLRHTGSSSTSTSSTASGSSSRSRSSRSSSRSWRRRRRRAQHHGRRHHLAQQRVRLPEGRRRRHRGVLGQCRLHLTAVHILAAHQHLMRRGGGSMRAIGGVGG